MQGAMGFDQLAMCSKIRKTCKFMNLELKWM